MAPFPENEPERKTCRKPLTPGRAGIYSAETPAVARGDFSGRCVYCRHGLQIETAHECEPPPLLTAVACSKDRSRTSNKPADVWRRRRSGQKISGHARALWDPARSRVGRTLNDSTYRYTPANRRI